MEKHLIRVYSAVGSAYCVEAEDGYAIFGQIKAAIAAGHPVELSFEHVEILTTAFLNTAVGQLYGVFSEEDIRANLQVSNLLPSGAVALKRVVETAKRYYKDPQALERSIAEIMGE